LTENLDPTSHIRVGKAIGGLRDRGVLIVGSGMSFHNMIGYGDPKFTRPSEQFDNWLTTLANNADARNEALANWAHAPCASQCHPMGSEEHLIPLMVSAGAGGNDPGRKSILR
jgi:aromatic ring-opening dioxygenase catalytic subunit (LigB family)